MYEYEGQSKSIRILKNLCTSDNQIVLNKILAPDLFDYKDSKSESWHSAKKIREVFMDNKSAPPPCFVMKNCVLFRGAVEQI